MDNKDISKESSIQPFNETFIAKSASILKEYGAIYLTLSFLACAGIGYYGEYKLLKAFGLNITVFAEIDDFFLASLKYPSVFFVVIIIPPVILVVISAFARIVHSSSQLPELYKLERLYSAIKGLDSRTKKQVEKERFLTEEFNKLTLLEKISLYPSYYRMIKSRKELVKSYESLTEDYKPKYELYLDRKTINKKANIIYFSTLILFLLILYRVNSFTNDNLQKELNRIINNPVSMATVSLRNKKTIPNSLISKQPLIFITATNKFMFFYQYGTKEKISVLSIPISSIESVHYSDFKIE